MAKEFVFWKCKFTGKCSLMEVYHQELLNRDGRWAGRKAFFWPDGSATDGEVQAFPDGFSTWQ